MDIEEERKQIFIATVCSICGFCRYPNPKFCLLLYDSDGEQFIREIASKIGKLGDISSNSFELLSSFEGFNKLFCKNSSCPLYDKQCDVKLSTRIACYRSFLEQDGINLQLDSLSNMYKKWSGIPLKEIGKNLDSIININKSLSKKQQKKLRKLIKKARKRVGGSNRTQIGINNKINKANKIVIHKNTKKTAETLFFYNSNDGWEEKISKYLEKNE